MGCLLFTEILNTGQAHSTVRPQRPEGIPMAPAATAPSGARQVYTPQEGRMMIKKLIKKKKIKALLRQVPKRKATR